MSADLYKRLQLIKEELNLSKDEDAICKLIENHEKKSPKKQESRTEKTIIKPVEIKVDQNKKPIGRYIPANIRRQVLERSKNQCEFNSKIKDKRCDAKTGLEFHHDHPFAWGGQHSAENLKYFCKSHNQLEAIKSFGLEKMQKYLK